MRAILSDEEESEESEDTRASHKPSRHIVDIGSQITDETVNRKKDVTPVPKQNPFFTLEQANTSRTWAQRAKTNPDSMPMTQHLQQSSADSAAPANSQSINLLEASSIEPDKEEKDRIAGLRNEVAELRSIIDELRQWQEQATPQLGQATRDASFARIALERTDIQQLHDNIHQIRSISIK